VGDPSHDPVAEALDALNEDDQHDHDGPHDFRHEALVAEADAEIAEPAAALDLILPSDLELKEP
jgi:hypothetical protein